MNNTIRAENFICDNLVKTAQANLGQYLIYLTLFSQSESQMNYILQDSHLENGYRRIIICIFLFLLLKKYIVSVGLEVF